MAVLVEGGLLLVAMALAWLFNVNVKQQLPADRAALGWALGRGLVATLPMLALFFWLYHSSLPALRRLRDQVEWLVGELFPVGSRAQFALVAVLAGVGEELLFRGVLQSLLVGWTTPFVGLVLGSLLFGLAHALSRMYFLLATLIGFYLGALVMQTDDLVAPMVAHALYDFLAMVYLSRNRAHHTSEDR